MKKLFVLALMMLSAAAQAQSAPAQSSQAKKDLVARVLVLQQSSIELTGQALVERPAQQMLQQAGLALQTRVPAEKREAVAKLVQDDVKKYLDETAPLVRQQAVKLAPTTIGPLLEEKFNEDELKQLIAFMESPVNRKYLQMGNELQKALGEKLVAQTQASVEPKVKALEQAIVKHLGLPPAPAAKASESNAKAPKK
ncbi:MAG TPA: DUF2059 domain-containing protein [Rhodoferax sp.]|nr:DUF2059 domain-containing protein [Rhodoferax sp.]